MILNLTQHDASAEQLAAGVIEPRDKSAVRDLLTFDIAPTGAEIERRAQALLAIAREHGACKVMLAGANYLSSAAEYLFALSRIQVLYSFSPRSVVEETLADGSVRKVTVFRHIGWVPGVIGSHDFLLPWQIEDPTAPREARSGYLCLGGETCEHSYYYPHDVE